MGRIVASFASRVARVSAALFGALSVSGCMTSSLTDLEGLSLSPTAFGSFAVETQDVGTGKQATAQTAYVSQKSWRYSLPKGVFFISLHDVGSKEEGGRIAFMARLDGPVFVPDKAHSHILKLAVSANPAQNPTVAFYRETSIIQTLRFGGADAQPQAAPRRSPPPAEGRRIAGPFAIDVTSEREVRAIEKKLEAAVVKKLKSVIDGKACKEIFISKPPECIEATLFLDDVRGEKGAKGRFVSLRVEPQGGEPKAAPSVAPDCSAGLCYRPLRRYLVSLRIGPRAQAGRMSDPWRGGFLVELPNESPVRVAPIDQPRLDAEKKVFQFERSGVLVSGTPGPTRDAIDLYYPRAGSKIGAKTDGRPIVLGPD